MKGLSSLASRLMGRSEAPGGELGHCVIRVLWGPRCADISDATSRSIATFALLSQISPALDSWSRLASSKKKALAAKPEDTRSKESIMKLLLDGQQQTEIAPREIIRDLGYRLSLWNKEASGISATISIHPGVACSALNNVVVLTLDEPQVSARTTPAEKLSILAGLADIWEPDSGIIYRDRLDVTPLKVSADKCEFVFAELDCGANKRKRLKRELVKVGDVELWVDRKSERWF